MGDGLATARGEDMIQANSRRGVSDACDVFLGYVAGYACKADPQRVVMEYQGRGQAHAHVCLFAFRSKL